jgi:hypothetical protein
VGLTSAPSFADLDGDGDLDAIVRGTGTAAYATFLNTRRGLHAGGQRDGADDAADALRRRAAT